MKLKEGQKITLLIVLIFLLVGAFYYLIFSSLTPSETPISRNSMLVVDIYGEMQERRAPDPFSEMFAGKIPSIQDVLFAIRKAKIDDKIRGIILRPGLLQMGWGKAEELRDALLDFKTSGKPVYAYFETASNQEYYLSTVADTILSVPSGVILVNGLLGGAVFMKGTLEKLGIDAEFIAYGKYKNAPDVFTRDRMSDAQREVINSLLDDYFPRLKQAIAQGRNMEESRVEQLIDKGFFSAPEAVKEGLLDTLMFYKDFQELLKSRIHKRLRFVSVGRYKKAPYPSSAPKAKEKFAVIYGVGTIIVGSENQFGQDGLITSEGMASSIHEAAKNENIKAIILRIDSPGGSGMASEIIWREVVKAREKKPVVVSVSDLAASGGYYISMAADSIVAHPSSIVGSIGVFMGKFILSGLYQKIGFTKEEIKRGKNADLFSEIKKFNPEQKEMMESYIMDFYRDFVTKVAEGRHMTYEEVDNIAQGRVWTGRQGKERGLVDRLGGLPDAINVAKKMVNIPVEEPVRLVFYPRQKSFLERILESAVDAKISLQELAIRKLPAPLQHLLQAIPFLQEGDPLFLMPIYPDIH